ncbi:MAG: hypothetical protein Q8S02_09060 [Hydrogenophaga sp.]|nr:hypothetical protein [Hydrogenophaga sp.]
MSDPLGFGKYVPGFDFLQSLAKQAAGGVAQGVQHNLPQMPSLGNWIAPTFNVEELDKRIDELKAVHFWLDQNSKALGATIQALEVQKMTLATLKGMNFNLGDVANALKIKAADTVAGMASGVASTAQSVAGRTPTAFAGLEIPPNAYHAAAPQVHIEPEPEPTPEPEPAPEPAPAPRKSSAKKAAAAEAPAAGLVDPMQWWGALSQQFQTIAGNALKDAAKQSSLDVTRNVASGLTGEAMKAATGMAGNVAKTVSDTVGAAAALGKAVTGGARGRGNALKSAAWPIPGAVSPELDTPAAKKPARKAAAKKAPAKKAAARKRAG